MRREMGRSRAAKMRAAEAGVAYVSTYPPREKADTAPSEAARVNPRSKRLMSRCPETIPGVLEGVKHQCKFVFGHRGHCWAGGQVYFAGKKRST